MLAPEELTISVNISLWSIYTLKKINWGMIFSKNSPKVKITLSNYGQMSSTYHAPNMQQ